MKKRFLILLAAVLILSSLEVASFGAENPRFSAGHSQGHAGETVSVTVSTSRITYQDYGMYVEYDPQVLTLLEISTEGCEAHNGTFGFGEPEPGRIKAAVYGGTDKEAEGGLFTLSFRIAEDAQPGTTEIRLSIISVRNMAQDYLIVDISDGSVTVQSLCDHSWDEGQVTKEPTCTEAGERLLTCTGCGETRLEVIEKLPHREVYREDGTKVVCQVCDTVLHDSEQCVDPDPEDAICGDCGYLFPEKSGVTGGSGSIFLWVGGILIAVTVGVAAAASASAKKRRARRNKPGK